MISVIVPVYKVEKELSRCVSSILNQTCRDLEIILVDDGSPDNCGAMCDEYAASDSRVTVIHQANQGLSAARNAGLDAAHGEYILFVDSDDWVESDLCASVLDDALSNNADIVVFGYILTDEKGHVMKESIPQERRVLHGSEGTEYLLRSRENQAWKNLYKRILFSDIRYPAGFFYEDITTSCRLFMKAGTVILRNRAFYHYCMRYSGITRSISLKPPLDGFRLSLSRYHYLQDTMPELAYLAFPDSVSFAFKAHNIAVISPSARKEASEISSFLDDNKASIIPMMSELFTGIKKLNSLYYKSRPLYYVYSLMLCLHRRLSRFLSR